jgi:anti-anti-sigma factor
MSTVTVDWNLDVPGAQRLDVLLEAEPADQEVVVDISAVAFVASSGLRVLLKNAQRLDTGGGELVIQSPSDVVMEVFTMSGFSEILTIR